MLPLYALLAPNDNFEIVANFGKGTFILGVQISSCGFARDGVTTVSFHRSVFISMRWKAIISRY